MADAEATAESAAAESCALHAIRVIPFDIGYDIEGKNLEKVASLIAEALSDRASHKRLFGTNALHYGKLSERLELYLFEDGIGVFLLKEEVSRYESYQRIDCDKILNERRKTHREILGHCHAYSASMDAIIDKLRGLVNSKKRRTTSLDMWEQGGTVVCVIASTS